MLLIAPITKSPLPITGRIGPVNRQDWYRTAEKAVAIQRHASNSKILVVTGFFSRQDERFEADCYESTFVNNLGVSPEDICVVKRGIDTASQVRFIAETADALDADLVMVSTFAHHLRVRWHARNVRARHEIAWGIPRPRELLTDLVLTIADPFIEIFGLGKWFGDRIEARRKRGVL